MVFDADEVERIIRIRVAKWLGVMPAQVDELNEQEFNDILQIMWADDQK